MFSHHFFTWEVVGRYFHDLDMYVLHNCVSYMKVLFCIFYGTHEIKAYFFMKNNKIVKE